MHIITRVTTIGPAGPNVAFGLEIVATDPAKTAGGEAVIDPSWTEPQIEEAIAEAAREGLRSEGATVAVDAPVTIIGGVSQV
jgi:hypothetical protein